MSMLIVYQLAHAFLKVGFFGFGGGFAMIPLMQRMVVHQNNWLSASQFAAAIALGQVTPGPVAISATFIGYKVAGLTGAVVATVAIFTPSLLVMYLIEKFYLKVREKEITQAVLHGILPVVVVLMLQTAISLGRPTVHSFWQILVIVMVAALTITRKVSYGMLVAGSTAAGALMSFWR